MMNKSYGGYLGFEFRQRKSYYPNAITLNTGRNALEYILRVRQYTKVFMPYFTCDAVLTPLNRLGIDYTFYHINKQLEPIFDINQLKTNEAFLYTNYFGLKSNYIHKQLAKFKNIIIDNAQAFFAKPMSNLDTFYSPRKFFGIPDGGYVFMKADVNIDLEPSTSYSNISHLAKQWDVSTEYGFADYQVNEKKISQAPLLKMSSLTKTILETIDYEWVAKRRKENFNLLNEELAAYNQFNEIKPTEALLQYPLFLLNDMSTLKKELLKHKIYSPIYWTNVLDWIPDIKCFEASLVKNTIHLPIDQRYSCEDMKYIAKTVKKLLK